MIRGACKGIAPVARGKGLELAIEVRRDVPRSSRFDLTRAAQVVRHLVDNAVKFTPKGSVTVRVCVEPGPVAEICVTDTGVGLSPARFEELSAPLVQGDDTLSRNRDVASVWHSRGESRAHSEEP